MTINHASTEVFGLEIERIAFSPQPLVEYPSTGNGIGGSMGDVSSMNSSFVVHQISDLHIGPMHYAPAIKLPLTERPREPRNLLLYRSYLRELPEKDLPDLVVISGDLTSFANDDELRKAEEEIKRIIERLRTKKPDWRTSDEAPYVLIVPGNHDLDWSKKTYQEKIEGYGRMATNLHRAGGVLSALYDPTGPETPPSYFDFGDACNVYFYLLNTTSLGGTSDPRIANLREQFADHYRALSSEKSNERFSVALDELKKLERQDPGYIDPIDIEVLEECVKAVPECRIKIAVMHHNPTSVPSDDIEAYDAIINTGILKMSLMRNKFDLILHGHRHLPHCTLERYTRWTNIHPQGFFVIGADSLGCNSRAPFLKITLANTANAHGTEPPAAQVSAVEWQHDGQTYHQSAVLAEEAIHRRVHAALREISRNIGRDESVSERMALLAAINMVAPHIDDLRLRLLDWGEESSKWIEAFHFRLDEYVQIFATDLAERSSNESPRYEQYLRNQYRARLVKLRGRVDQKLVYSRRVHEAILRTNWTPSETMWGDHTMVEASTANEENLEIVRVLLRDTPATKHIERRTLENLDSDHRFFAIPLFVASPKQIGRDQCADFVLGLRGDHQVLRCFEFQSDIGKVSEVRDSRSYELYRLFEDILRHPSLQTVEQFLGSGRMIRDPSKQTAFAENYDSTRAASSQILEKIRNHLQSVPKDIGVDIGCGTGNYTFPLAQDFRSLIGLDQSEAMLAVAGKKAGADQIRWVHANALATTLEDQSSSAIWSVSTFHYFRGEQQKLFLREMFRLLRPGGGLVVDIEFAEQHASLWLVEFFPSLRKRYEGCCLGRDQYRDWLTEIGFSSVEFDHAEIADDERDNTLRIGQRKPELYLDEHILSGIPAFHEMSGQERLLGKRKLERAINDRTILRTIEEYNSRAALPGTVGLIVARR